jgi:hypothetical protein
LPVPAKELVRRETAEQVGIFHPLIISTVRECPLKRVAILGCRVYSATDSAKG